MKATLMAVVKIGNNVLEAIERIRQIQEEVWVLEESTINIICVKVKLEAMVPLVLVHKSNQARCNSVSALNSTAKKWKKSLRTMGASAWNQEAARVKLVCTRMKWSHLMKAISVSRSRMFPSSMSTIYQGKAPKKRPLSNLNLTIWLTVAPRYSIHSLFWTILFIGRRRILETLPIL